MDSTRQQKVSKLVQKELAFVFQKKGSSLAGGALITVTEVKVSPDLSQAKVYLSFFPVKDKEAFLKNVQNHTPMIRHELGNQVKKQLRIVPELIFYIDDSLDRAEKIDRLLKS
jgi:ribosome-binding factor A